MLNLTINLDGGKSFSSTLQRDNLGNNSQQISLSGIGGEDKKWNYNINANRNVNNSTEDSTLGGNTTYSGSKASANASASINKNNKQASLGVAGSVIATSQGIFFGQNIGESAAIVEAKDAQGAEVMPAVGVQIDSAGYALLPSLSPYKLNDVQLLTGSMSEGVELQGSSAQAVPRSGAIVHVKFKTSKGTPLLLKTRFADDSPLPFGASVKDKDGNMVGYIGQGGKLLARVKQATGYLFVDLDGGEKCMLRYENAAAVLTSFKSTVCQTSLN